MPSKKAANTNESKRKHEDTTPTKDTEETTKLQKGEDQKDVKQAHDATSSNKDSGEANLGNVVGGYKAALNNDKVSDEAKEHAKAELEKLEPQLQEQKDKKSLEGKTLGHVIGGYKATLSNEKSSEEAKNHAQKMLDELQGSGYNDMKDDEKEKHHGKDIGHVIGGYKAALSNPNTSEEAREHAKKMIEELGGDAMLKHPHKDDSEKDLSHVVGGYKATLSNPNSSEAAKEHAQHTLDALGVETGKDASHHSSHKKDDSEKNPANVEGGLKAAISNPNVSEEAKDHARAKLEESAKVAH